MLFNQNKDEILLHTTSIGETRFNEEFNKAVLRLPSVCEGVCARAREGDTRVLVYIITVVNNPYKTRLLSFKASSLAAERKEGTSCLVPLD